MARVLALKPLYVRGVFISRVTNISTLSASKVYHCLIRLIRLTVSQVSDVESDVSDLRRIVDTFFISILKYYVSVLSYVSEFQREFIISLSRLFSNISPNSRCFR